jgi:hypothetical protein
MLNVNLYLTFNLLLIVIFSFKNKPLFSILDFQQIMKNSKFTKIIVLKKFEIENGILGLERDIYLSIVKFLDSSILRKV